MTQEMELEVFRAGDYGPKGSWNEQALDRMAEDYSSDLHEAPVTLDHAQTGPALGWVSGLRRQGDRLIARLMGVSDGLMDLLRRGAFKKRSVEIYHRMPDTDRPYLKAVSFLGAGTPEVKGLRDVIFSDDGDSDCLCESRGGHECFDFAETTAPTDGKPPHAFDTVGKDVFRQLETELRRTGRWMPAWENQGLAEFFHALASVDEIELPGEMSLPPVQWFTEFLKSLPAYLPMGEAAPSTRSDERESIPSGIHVSSDSIDLHRRVTRMRDDKPSLGYGEALRLCAGRDA